jgi:hypothetical protein
MGGRAASAIWAVSAFATALTTSAGAQTSARTEASTAESAERIAANDALAATAGTPAAEQASVPLPLPAAIPGAPASPAAPPSTFERIATWMGVEPDSVRWLRLGTWEGNLGFTYGGTQVESGPKSDTLTSTTRLATEYLTIRNNGYSILDPRFITGSIGVTLGWDQVRQRFQDQDTNQNGTLNGYSFDATFFGQKALNGRVWADRVESFTTLPFTGDTKSTVSTAGAMLNLMQHSWLRDAEILPWFDAWLQAYRTRTLDEYHFGSTSTNYDQTQDVVRLYAHNGGETSDLSVTADLVDFKFPTFPQGAYRNYGAAANYSRDFGPNLDTTWTSVATYNDRKGDIALETFTLDETVDVHHTTDLRSTYWYSLLRQQSASGTVVDQVGAAEVTYNLWRYLSLSASATGRHDQYPNGPVEGASGSLSADYTRPLASGAQVYANAQATYAYASNNLSSGEISVIDEASSAPAAPGVGAGVLLNNPFVVAQSIIVVDTRGGARIPTTINVDYTVATEGNQSRILVLPTSPVIRPGDPLAISYTYQVPTQASYHASSESLTVGADWNWLALNYNHTQTQAPQVTQAGVTFVGNSSSDALTAVVRGNWEAFNASAIASLVHYSAPALAYNTQTYTVSGAYQPIWAVALNFTSAWSRTDYTLPVARTSGNEAARIDLNLYAPPGSHNDVLTATLFGLYNKLTDSEIPTQTLKQVGCNVDYTLGKLTLKASAMHGTFTIGSSTTRTSLFNLSANRRF